MNSSIPDKRRFGRKKLSEMTWLINPIDGQLNECEILNLSPIGALIETPNAMQLPNYLLILMKGESYSLECIVKWREKTKLGVAFA